jgi:hypothetical protein
MAGSEQRPTDDIEGHGFRHGQDAEAADEDEVGDDTEGHMAKGRGQRIEAGDDVEGHSGKRCC